MVEEEEVEKTLVVLRNGTKVPIHGRSRVANLAGVWRCIVGNNTQTTKERLKRKHSCWLATVKWSTFLLLVCFSSSCTCLCRLSDVFHYALWTSEFFLRIRHPASWILRVQFYFEWFCDSPPLGWGLYLTSPKNSGKVRPMYLLEFRSLSSFRKEAAGVIWSQLNSSRLNVEGCRFFCWRAVASICTVVKRKCFPYGDKHAACRAFSMLLPLWSPYT